MPTVTCRPLGPLLKQWGVLHVHLWVLDVEGAEEEVLKTIDFAAVTVDVIALELDGGAPEKDARCIALLERAGFNVHSKATRNTWFTRAGFVPYGDRR